jgi:hypothetical protein
MDTMRAHSSVTFQFGLAQLIQGVRPLFKRSDARFYSLGWILMACTKQENAAGTLDVRQSFWHA